MIRLKTIALFLFFGILTVIPNLPGQDCCSPDEVMDLCFLSAADFCFSNKGSCNEYSLDGQNMAPGLVKKLESPDNFGPSGIVDCEFKLKKLDKTKLSLQYINECGCDIIFMPSIFVDPANNEINNDSSFMPESVLDTIRKWSVDCTSNLVIASQGEARAWGYESANESQNPNLPVANSSYNTIFDGPFGKISSFEQGGFYKGIFTHIPASGAEILARDDLGQPSIAYDKATGDIISGDIGIFCTGPGSVSSGSGLSTGNDTLVCNLFALACDLAERTKFTNIYYELCDEEDSYILPSGEEEYEVGIYVDTLQTRNGCDSVIIIELIDCQILSVPNIFSPNNDGINDYFNITVSEFTIINTFKIFNRWGQLVYDNETPEQGWDGTFEGKNVPSDVYIYKIDYSNSLSTRRDSMTGDVTLYR